MSAPVRTITLLKAVAWVTFCENVIEKKVTRHCGSCVTALVRRIQDGYERDTG